ncbi:MAG: hypothetical protein Q8P83_01835 [bacterium]|nr:hypothetical protein [bacterium]
MSKKAEIIKNILLGLGAVGGVIVVSIVAPNLFSILSPRYKTVTKYTNNQVKRSLKRLEMNDMVNISEKDSMVKINLTKNGERKVIEYNLENLKIKRDKSWDRKWRIVIFDIPEKYKSNRTVFARKLRELGFVNLQKSVWVTPYPCEDEIDFLKEIYEIRPFIRLITADRIDIQHDLLKQFKLVV